MKNPLSYVITANITNKASATDNTFATTLCNPGNPLIIALLANKQATTLGAVHFHTKQV